MVIRMTVIGTSNTSWNQHLIPVADAGFGERGGGVNCYKQGRSGERSGMWKKMEIRKCLEDF